MVCYGDRSKPRVTAHRIRFTSFMRRLDVSTDRRPVGERSAVYYLKITEVKQLIMP